MRKIIGAAFISLDGVMQAPGGPTEDPTGGFQQGGWLPNYGDESTNDTIGALFGSSFDLLLGRRTYDIFAAFWPFSGDDMGKMFDRVGKHVVTRGNQPLTWQNSHRVPGIDAVAELKKTDGPDLIIQGSSTLYPQLLAAGLLDRLTLLIFPVTLGKGKKLFGDSTPVGALRMTSHTVSPRGNIVATYEPAGALELGTYLGPDSKASAAELTRRKAMADGTW
jgi:dihydrofolate reductase